MGDLVTVSIPDQAISDAKKAFSQIAKTKKTKLLFGEEAGFARQLIESNDYLFKVALKNPQSLKNALVNLSAIGLTLNPARRFAYLVPRDNAICLDISYIGLVHLATNSGSILWAKSELVCETDKFTYNGVCNVPDHAIIHPFNEKLRGKIIGVYSLAKTHNNDFLVDLMSTEDVEEIRKYSKTSNPKYTPWVKHWGEMAKKTIIKRGYKLWPKTDRDHLDTAIDVINDHEGINFIEHDPVNIDQYQVSKKMQTRFNEIFFLSNDLDMFIFQVHTVESNEQWVKLMKSFPTDKTACKKKVAEMLTKGQVIHNNVYMEWIDAIEREDMPYKKQLEGEMSTDGVQMLYDRREASQ